MYTKSLSSSTLLNLLNYMLARTLGVKIAKIKLTLLFFCDNVPDDIIVSICGFMMSLL